MVKVPIFNNETADTEYKHYDVESVTVSEETMVYYSGDIMYFSRDGNLGYIYKDEVVMLPAEIEFIFPFKSGLPVTIGRDNEGYWRYIDILGNYVMPDRFTFASQPDENWCSIFKGSNGLYGYVHFAVDKDDYCMKPFINYQRTEPEFEEAGEVTEEDDGWGYTELIAIVKKDGKEYKLSLEHCKLQELE